LYIGIDTTKIHRELGWLPKTKFPDGIQKTNHYHEHVDHIAAFMMGAYDASQVGDIYTVDWATPHTVKSVAQHSVWADPDPEGAAILHSGFYYRTAFLSHRQEYRRRKEEFGLAGQE